MVIYTKQGIKADIITTSLDYVGEDGIVKNVPYKEVVINSAEDLEDLTDYPCGSIAYTADLSNIFQMDTDGTWVAIISSSDTWGDYYVY